MTKEEVKRAVVSAIGGIARGDYGEDAKALVWDMNRDTSKNPPGGAIFQQALTSALCDELSIDN